MDYSRIINKLPRNVLEKVREILEKYQRTGDYRYAEMAIQILDAFSDDASRELVRALRKR